MNEPLIVVFRVALVSILRRFVSWVRSAMLDNLLAEKFKHRIEVFDSKGSKVTALRMREYACRWYPLEWFPAERIDVTPGKLTEFAIEAPHGAECKVLHGGVGQSCIVFQMRAPQMRPTYLFRRRALIEVVIRYEGKEVFTQEAPPPSWICRVPTGKPLPKSVEFNLFLPQSRPMLSKPCLYYLDKLSDAESGRPDPILDRAEQWERIPDLAMNSRLRVSESLLEAHWLLYPTKLNTAFMIKWNLWQTEQPREGRSVRGAYRNQEQLLLGISKYQ